MVGIDVWRYTRQFVAPATASLAGAGAVALWQQSAWAIQSDLVAIVVLGAAGIAIYAGVMFLLVRGQLAQIAADRARRQDAGLDAARRGRLTAQSAMPAPRSSASGGSPKSSTEKSRSGALSGTGPRSASSSVPGARQAMPIDAQ